VTSAHILGVEDNPGDRLLSERASGTRRVLFVDDDSGVRHAFERTARELGYAVDLASSAGEAVERGHMHAYPVVVTDLFLRGTEGYTVIDALWNLRPETVFIILTARPEAFQRRRLAATGSVASLVSKPWDHDDLATKLESAFALHERRALHSGPTETRPGSSVLVVEDSVSDAQLLQHYLSLIPGVTVALAATLAEATRQLHERPFDAIFTDLSLPDAQGVDTVLRLRAACADAALIVCSGVDDEALQLQLVHLGAHESLNKSDLTLAGVARALRFAKERKNVELRLARMAYFDPLTGVSNRAGWHERTATLLGRATRQQERVAVLMIDLDGFKGLNDEFGHDTGDAVLQEVAGRLQRMVREYDIVARLGGDEFALLLSDLSKDFDPEAFGARVCEELARRLVLPGGAERCVGASIGVALFPDHGRSISALLRIADAAMYQAKAHGKGRAALADTALSDRA